MMMRERGGKGGRDGGEREGGIERFRGEREGESGQRGIGKQREREVEEEEQINNSVAALVC